MFGYTDKSYLIELLKHVFNGDQNKTLEIYRNIYNQGVEPKVFINDFLEILYYFKNINTLKQTSKNFDLNNEEFEIIKKLSADVNNETLILFWQFTIKTLDELNIVLDQNISVEMFLLRLLHIKSVKENIIDDIKNLEPKPVEKKKISEKKTVLEPINQIKNIVQEKNFENPKIKNKSKDYKIKSLNDLIEVCNKEKEIKLKYEIENNVNLISFEKGKIEISINEKLEKDFIKILSAKLLEWTNVRWIITLSKKEGTKSKREIQTDLKKKLFEDAKKTETYKKILNTFSDAELIDIEKKDE